MTMTRDEAVIILGAMLARAKESRTDQIALDAADALTIAIAALSAQEPWGWEWVDGSDTGVVPLHLGCRIEYRRVELKAVAA